MSAAITHTIEGSITPDSHDLVSRLPVHRDGAGYFLTSVELGEIIGVLKGSAEILSERRPGDHLADCFSELATRLDAVRPGVYKKEFGL